jgi:N-formylglutamate deformylase
VSTTDTPVYRLSTGTLPLLISMPHVGTRLPDELVAQMNPGAALRQDTDWHLERLYAFAVALGASVLEARVSRYVIDLNRPPGGESLYPGQTTTGLCPTETFRGEPLYQCGAAPDATERQRRLHAYWMPYHAALSAELARLETRHGGALLWDAHSIAGVLPRLFEGQLPDLNFGTNSGQSCGAAVLESVATTAGRSATCMPSSSRCASPFTWTKHRPSITWSPAPARCNHCLKACCWPRSTNCLDRQPPEASQAVGSRAIQAASAAPISAGESSCRKCSPGTVTSSWFGQLRQKARFSPVRKAPGSALTNSFGNVVDDSHPA